MFQVLNRAAALETALVVLVTGHPRPKAFIATLLRNSRIGLLLRGEPSLLNAMLELSKHGACFWLEPVGSGGARWGEVGRAGGLDLRLP